MNDFTNVSKNTSLAILQMYDEDVADFDSNVDQGACSYTSLDEKHCLLNTLVAYSSQSNSYKCLHADDLGIVNKWTCERKRCEKPKPLLV